MIMDQEAAQSLNQDEQIETNMSFFHMILIGLIRNQIRLNDNLINHPH